MKIIIIRNTVWESVRKDISFIVVLLFAFWFNHQFIGGSYVVNVLILIGALITSVQIVAGYKKRAMTIGEARKELDRLEADPQ